MSAPAETAVALGASRAASLRRAFAVAMLPASILPVMLFGPALLRAPERLFRQAGATGASAVQPAHAGGRGAGPPVGAARPASSLALPVGAARASSATQSGRTGASVVKRAGRTRQATGGHPLHSRPHRGVRR